MRYITGSKLKGDICSYRRLKNRQYSPKEYYKSEKIFSGATELLDKYADDEIGVRAKDNKIMAQYIDTFAIQDREKLLDKLQKTSVFDVRKYISDNKRTYWQKLFNIHPEQKTTLTAAMMQKRIRDYNKLNKELATGWFHKEKLYDKQYRMEKEAAGYAAEFMDDKVKVARDEVSVLKQYFHTFSNQNDEIGLKAALTKIEQTPLEEFPESLPSRWQRFKVATQNKWQNFTGKFKTGSAKIIHGDFNHRGLGKAAAAIAFFAVVGATIKSDSWAKTFKKANTTEQKAPDRAPDAITQAAKINTTAFTAPVKANSELSHEQKIWQNFYDTKSQIQADDMGVDLQKLYKKVSEQQKKGIFQMPENISIERFTYTHLIYKAYGLVSPLEQAVNGDKALNASQQQQLNDAINTAGENGLGVKKLAQNVAAKHGRKLSNHSAMRNASADLKAKYADNSALVRNLKQKQI